jgi:hypothetical protein
MRIKNLTKDDIKKHGRCEKTKFHLFKEDYFYKNIRILSIRGNIVKCFF